MKEWNEVEDPLEQMDATEYRMIVRKKNQSSPWYCRGLITNHCLDKAFDETSPDQKDSIEAVKWHLWVSFKKAYMEKE